MSLQVQGHLWSRRSGLSLHQGTSPGCAQVYRELPASFLLVSLSTCGSRITSGAAKPGSCWEHLPRSLLELPNLVPAGSISPDHFWSCQTWFLLGASPQITSGAAKSGSCWEHLPSSSLLPGAGGMRRSSPVLPLEERGNGSGAGWVPLQQTQGNTGIKSRL